MKLLLILTLATPHAFAVKDTWWGRFCEKHLVAPDPYQYEEAVVALRQESVNNEDFIQKLIHKYTEFGGQLSWGIKNPYHREFVEIALRTLGNELRWQARQAPSPDIEFVLESYSKFEYRPRQ